MDRASAENRSLLEKIRVLTCKYLIAQTAVDDTRSLNDKLQVVTDLIPQAFEDPTILAATIQVDGKSYGALAFAGAKHRIREAITVDKIVRGYVTIGFLKKDASEIQLKTALSSEASGLIESVARKIAHLIERHEAKEKKKLLQEQLRHADRLATIGQLAAGIAHELNNPLSDILGFAQLASNAPDLPETVYQDLAKIVKSALYTREVIKKVLFFSRQAGHASLDINLNHLIREWMDFFEFRCAQNNIDIDLEMDADLPSITGDPAQLNQVLINLVVNAIHAMPEGGVLTISTGVHRQRVFMKVQDTGEGIEATIKDKIFLPFFTTKDVDQGTGLGLSVVYGIINEHGGEVHVDSLMGVGSTFKVVFPMQA